MRSTEARDYLRPWTEERRFLPEGPRRMVVNGEQVLVWVNIQTGVNVLTGTIHAHHTDNPRDDFSIPCPGRPGFILPILGGGKALVGLEKQLRICDLVEGKWSEPLATIPDHNPRTIINDGEVVPGGKAIVFGTKDMQFKEQIANLYLYTVDDNRVSLLVNKQLCSNGKVIVRDARGLILFDIDTPTRKVVRYRLDIATRTATFDGVAVDVADQVGFPDGMCDCGDGTVIIAFYNPDFAEAGKAIRFDLSTGKAVEEWTTPGSPRVTCPLLSTGELILTTATEGMTGEMRARCTDAGSLFAASVWIPSCPEPELVRMP